MRYLVRLAHAHESFRRAELEALAALAAVPLRVLDYQQDSPFCLVELPSDDAARSFISRAILGIAIYEWWGSGDDYDELQADVAASREAAIRGYRDVSFRFSVDSFRGKRSMAQQRDLIESFAWFDWQGAIVMRGAEVEMVIFEDWEARQPGATKPTAPRRVHLGRLLGTGRRDSVLAFDLKKRSYISRTSMDAELSLVTALLTLAAPGKLLLDPFVGTGSFTVTAAYFGATALGGDIDARSVRGAAGRSIVSNFAQYGLRARLLDSFVGDLGHTPLRRGQWLDGIVCDPPYGIREGPKTLGSRPGRAPVALEHRGQPAHLQDGWVAPKRPYGFDDMMADLLDLAFGLLVDDGRLSVWMPTANDDGGGELPVPSHAGLAVVSVCTQHFNKWSRRLLTYRRLPLAQVDASLLRLPRAARAVGAANDVNEFRKKYFDGFRA